MYSNINKFFRYCTHQQILQILLSSKERPINERPVNYFGVVVLANAGNKFIASQMSGVKVVLQLSVDFVEKGALTDPRPITAV